MANVLDGKGSTEIASATFPGMLATRKIAEIAGRDCRRFLGEYHGGLHAQRRGAVPTSVAPTH